MKLYLAESFYNNHRWAQVVSTKEEAEKGFMEDMKNFALGFIENEGLEEDWELYFETEEIALKVHIESLGSSLYDELDFDEVPKMNIDEMRNLISEIEDETSSIYRGYTAVSVRDIDDASDDFYDEIYWTEEDNTIYLLRTY